MQHQKTLPTLGGRSSFDFCGSIREGTHIWFGKDKRNKSFVSTANYEDLLTEFKGKIIQVGNGRRNRPPGSLGAWLKEHVTSAVIAAYVAKLLIEEGYAVKKEGAIIEVFD